MAKEQLPAAPTSLSARSWGGEEGNLRHQTGIPVSLLTVSRRVKKYPEGEEGEWHARRDMAAQQPAHRAHGSAAAWTSSPDTVYE